MGIYNYDPTILDLMQIPSALDRQTLIDNLIMETAEQEKEQLRIPVGPGMSARDLGSR